MCEIYTIGSRVLGKLNVFIYVDDMIIIGNNQKGLLNFNNYLGKYFKMKDLEILKYYLAGLGGSLYPREFL